jgi:hypothetical protein
MMQLPGSAGCAKDEGEQPKEGVTGDDGEEIPVAMILEEEVPFEKPDLFQILPSQGGNKPVYRVAVGLIFLPEYAP